MHQKAAMSHGNVSKPLNHWSRETDLSPHFPSCGDMTDSPVLVIMCFLLRVEEEVSTGLCSHSCQRQGCLFGPCPALTEQTWKRLSDISSFHMFSHFLTGVYVVQCCRNHIVGEKVENDPRHSYGRNCIFQARRSLKSLCAQKNISLLFAGLAT